MALSFVRELFADAEKLPAFTRAASHLKEGAGRIGLSGLTPSAKAVILVLLRRATGRPLIIVVADNRAAEDMLPVLQSFCELTGAADPESVVKLSARDVLPFQNLSPHPEIQEERATALWKIATGAASLVVCPVAASTIRLRSAEYYADLARVVRRSETLDTDALIRHLSTVGYNSADVVEMPGQYALRGGILDVYPPEADRPLRIEFFGDDVESIRKFDPASQRSSTPVDEAVLLPLSETPVSEATLAAIHARLSGSRIGGSEQSVTDAISAAGVTVFPGWEFYASIAGDSQSLFDLMPNALVIVDEPSAVKAESDRWWEKVLTAHDRSGVGSLVKPEEIFIEREEWQSLVNSVSGAEMEELSLTVAGDEDDLADFRSQPTMRFHGSVPAMVEEVKKVSAEGQRVIFAAPNMGEVERLADIFSEYGVHFRLGSRAPKLGTSETFLDETAYATGDLSAATIVKAAVPHGVALPDSRLVIFGAQDLFDDSEVVVKRPLRQKSVVSTFLSDFRDLAIGDYVVHVEHGIAQYQGLREIAMGEGESKGEFMVLEFAEAAKLYVPLTRLDLIQKYRSTEGGRPPL